MAPTPPLVEDEQLIYQQDGQSAQVTVGSAEWFRWLETASTFTYRTEHGTFTARLERSGNKRGGTYWRAYRKRAGKLRRAYLGKSVELTLERLQMVAALLAGQEPVENEATDNAFEAEAAALQSIEGPHGRKPGALSTVMTHSPPPQEPAHQTSSGRDLPTGTTTLLFTGVEESTRLLQRLGKRSTEVLPVCRHLLREVFQQHHGHEVDTQEDVFLVAFARATDAVLSAVEGQRSLAAHSWPEGVVVRMCMGLHTGEPALTSAGYVGLDVHRAARIMSAAHGGQVLLSQTTRDLVEQALPEGVSLRDLGAHRLKDLEHPHPLFQLVISDLAADFPPLKTLDASANNLPIQPTPFIGREQEVAAVAQLLRHPDVHMATLTGAGGMGKTRLALQVAAELVEQFADGVFVVPLDSLSDAELVVPTVMQALSIRETGGQSPLVCLKSALKDKQMLLLFDNFEQVITAAGQMAELLTACPQLKIIVTSRARLHLRAEHEFAVPPLALPDPKHLPEPVALSQYEAVALFISRAQAARLDFQVTNANAPAVAELCARLDGLPLAIELAAARIKLLPPQALLARLSQRLAILTGGTRDAPARQQTLRNTLQWSYDLLSTQEQHLFRWLSIFVGGCTLAAAEAVCRVAGEQGMEVLEGVSSLLDKSLVQQTEPENEEPRLRLLETIREYGRERLQETGELVAAQHAHATYYLELAEEADSQLQGPEQVAWQERVEREYENLRAAIEWTHSSGLPELALRISSALWLFWVRRGYPREGSVLLEHVLEVNAAAPAALRAKALQAAGVLAFTQQDFRKFGQLVEAYQPLVQELGDQQGIAIARLSQGIIALLRHPEATVWTQLEESLVDVRKHGDPLWITMMLYALGRMAYMQGYAQRAQALIEECLSQARAVGDTLFQGRALLFLGQLAQAQEDLTTAQERLEEELPLSQGTGARTTTPYALTLQGLIRWRQGKTDEARASWKESLQLYREQGNSSALARGLLLLGRIALGEGDMGEARADYAESLTIALEMNLKGFTATGLKGLGVIAATAEQLALATRLWGAAEELREDREVSLPAAVYEQAVQRARNQLGEEAYAAAWQEGRAMPLEQITASALSAQQTEPLSRETTPPLVPPARKTPPAPAGLTAREVDVLGLLAQGLTDAQIAEQLVIARRTVNWYLTSIYSKIGVSSRAAATRYAVEQHLV